MAAAIKKYSDCTDIVTAMTAARRNLTEEDDENQDDSRTQSATPHYHDQSHKHHALLIAGFASAGCST